VRRGETRAFGADRRGGRNLSSRAVSGAEAAPSDPLANICSCRPLARLSPPLTIRIVFSHAAELSGTGPLAGEVSHGRSIRRVSYLLTGGRSGDRRSAIARAWVGWIVASKLTRDA
jgi:hypothetical protein